MIDRQACQRIHAAALHVLADTGVRVDDLVNMFRAGDDIAMISKEYGVESALIETAIRVQFRTAA